MALLALPAWLWWVALAVLLILVDLGLLGAQFVLVTASLAALAAAAAAAFDVGVTGQVWTFLIALLVVTPVAVYALRHRRAGAEPGPLESDWARGAAIMVTTRGNRCVAKLKGDEYPVALVDGSAPEAGEALVVDRMEGITLIARRPEGSEGGS